MNRKRVKRIKIEQEGENEKETEGKRRGGRKGI